MENDFNPIIEKKSVSWNSFFITLKRTFKILKIQYFERQNYLLK